MCLNSKVAALLSQPTGKVLARGALLASARRHAKDSHSQRVSLDGYISNAQIINLSGDGWSGRAEDSILHGCVPVVVMDEVHASWESLLDWSLFSLRCVQRSGLLDWTVTTRGHGTYSLAATPKPGRDAAVHPCASRCGSTFRVQSKVATDFAGSSRRTSSRPLRSSWGCQQRGCWSCRATLQKCGPGGCDRIRGVSWARCGHAQ